ncbi:DUF6090 family protein [Robiginitalea sp. IMCC44478]|uniref:DUF6090 family protein n=1 Tax=Robiginitalea sp. IMCC44478 TaxID=3459122 RepID=UPI004042BA91
MIKIFRTIRKRFLSENKFSKYLAYAIGETILVVLGILIALQVNTWNEERKDRQEEQLILSALNKDFTKNLELFETAKEIHYTAKANAEKLLALVNSPKEENFFTDENIALVKGALESHTFNPSNGVVHSLISSGNYQLLQNDSLQSLIISWNDVLQDYTEEELAATDFWNTRYEPFLIEQAVFSIQDMEKALGILKSPVHKSLIARRIHYVGNITRAIEEEPIEHYLKEVVRLTSSSLRND